MIKPRLYHFAMLAGILLILFASLYFDATLTDAYEEAERFAREDRRVTDLVGDVTKVRLRFWDDFQFNSVGSGGEANFVLDVFGSNNKAIMDVHLRRMANQWYEDVIYIRVNGDSEVHSIHAESK